MLVGTHINIVICIFILSLQKVENVLAVVETEADHVKVEFDFVLPSDWTDGVVSQFKSMMVVLTNDFCQSNFSVCRINSASNIFQPSDIVIVPGYPQQKPGDKTDSLLLFYGQLPLPLSGQVPKLTLQDLVLNNKTYIQNGLKAVSTGTVPAAFRISYVNDILAVTPADQSLNVIVIPIVCGVVLLLSAAIIGLEINRYLKRKALIGEIARKHAKGTNTSNTNRADLFQAKTPEENDRR